MKKTNEQIKTALRAAWKLAIEKSDNEGVSYQVYLDNDFDFRVLYTRTNNATFCVVEHDSHGVESTDDVDGVLDMYLNDIMSGVDEVSNDNF
jgi:hypothetical protein